MRPLYLISLDGVGWSPLRQWIRQGRLPNLHAAVQVDSRPRICLLDNKAFMRTENSWLTFAQGVVPELAREWAHCTYSADDYSYREHVAYRFREAPPFFRCTDCSTLIFDVPLVQVDPAGDHPANRVEIYGWGAESNQFAASSIPADSLSRLEAVYGPHPVHSQSRQILPDAVAAGGGGDHVSRQYRLPNLYQPLALQSLREGLIEGVRRRTTIIRDLLAAQRPEFAICVYAEAHTAGHMFWHLSQPHPLHDPQADDGLLAVLQEIDTGIGTLLADFPEADVVLFSPQGMQANFSELLTSTCLPEMLFRRSRRDWMLAGDRQVCLRLDPAGYGHWKDAVAALLNPAHSHRLDTPARLADKGDPLDWSPARWYQPLWPELEAFALPSFSEGLVRLNLRGREGGAAGVEWDAYDEVCQRITDDLLQWRDVPSGRRLVTEVVRTRSSPDDSEGPLALMPADLVVRWREPVITNHVVHPLWGEIGPLPYFRTGAHSYQGMLVDLTPAGSFLPASGARLPLTAFVQAIRQRLHG